MRIDVVVNVTINIVYETPADEPTSATSDNTHLAECNECGWTKRYSSQEAASRGLAAHRARWCPGPPGETIEGFIARITGK